MISRLRGILDIKKPPFVLIDVNGVGYGLQVPMSTVYRLPDIGKPVTLLTVFHVREDAQILYGFYEESERVLFKALIKVSGVGPKMALTILSGMEVNQFIQCVEQRDIGLLVRLPGVGKKTAERLVVEMKDKLSTLSSDGTFDFSKIREPLPGISPSKLAESEAVSALIALGYKPQEASRAIAKLEHDGSTSQELIRRALQGLAKA